MPLGLIIIHWDEREGMNIVTTYPEGIMLEEKILMQVYSEHEFTGEPGMITLSAANVNLASYYTGPESALYIILVLNNDEEGDAFEEGLSEISRQIMANLESINMKDLLPTYFQRLSLYPNLSNEQRLAILYQSDTKRMIIKRLREDIAVSKSEIDVWLKDVYKGGFIDIEAIVTSLVQSGIVKVVSVKGIASDLLFMNEDLRIYRHPPMELIRNPVEHRLPERLKTIYLKEVRKFFETYTPKEEDNLNIIEKVILTPQSYEILKLLREMVVTRLDLEKMKKKGIDDPDKALTALYEAKVLTVLQDDKGSEYYALLTDFAIKIRYPRYNLNTIRKSYKNRLLNPFVLIKALELMKEEYYNQLKLKNAFPQGLKSSQISDQKQLKKTEKVRG